MHIGTRSTFAFFCEGGEHETDHIQAENPSLFSGEVCFQHESSEMALCWVMDNNDEATHVVFAVVSPSSVSLTDVMLTKSTGRYALAGLVCPSVTPLDLGGTTLELKTKHKVALSIGPDGIGIAVGEGSAASTMPFRLENKEIHIYSCQWDQHGEDDGGGVVLDLAGLTRESAEKQIQLADKRRQALAAPPGAGGASSAQEPPVLAEEAQGLALAEDLATLCIGGTLRTKQASLRSMEPTTLLSTEAVVSPDDFEVPKHQRWRSNMWSLPNQ